MRSTTLIVAAVLNALLVTALASADSAPVSDITTESSTGARVPGVAMPKPRPIGDLNADGNVDGADLALLLGQWGKCGTNVSAAYETTCSGDFNNDSQVDMDDLVTLLNNWR